MNRKLKGPKPKAFVVKRYMPKPVPLFTAFLETVWTIGAGVAVEQLVSLPTNWAER